MSNVIIFDNEGQPLGWFDPDTAGFFDPQIFDSGAGSGNSQIAGTATITFTQAAPIGGKGSLAGLATITFTQAAPITGRGALAGAATITFSDAAAIFGRGVLAGLANITFTQAAPIQAKGSLAGVATLTFTQAAPIQAKGDLAGAAALTFTQAAPLTGRAAAAGAASMVFSEAADLGGRASAAGAVDWTFGEAADLGEQSSNSQIAGSASITFGENATPQATGSLAGACSMSFGSSANLTAGAEAVKRPVFGRRFRNIGFKSNDVPRVTLPSYKGPDQPIEVRASAPGPEEVWIDFASTERIERVERMGGLVLATTFTTQHWESARAVAEGMEAQDFVRNAGSARMDATETIFVTDKTRVRAELAPAPVIEDHEIEAILLRLAA